MSYTESKVKTNPDVEKKTGKETGDSGGSENSDSDFDDDAMFRMDAHLVQILMERKGNVADRVSLNALIQGFCTTGRIIEADIFLQKISERGFVPDDVSCNLLIKQYCKDKILGRAVDCKLTGFHNFKC